MTSRLFPYCATILLFMTAPVRADLFESDVVLSIELHGPVQRTIRDKRDSEERPFRIVVNGESWPVEVRVRGKSRRDECSFPPLRLNFRSDDVNGGPFAGLDKVKLVTHCQTGQHFDANLLEEYAAYRMFSQLSGFSHRVRLMHIRYFDTARPGKDPLVRYAFALEPVEHLAERMTAEVQRVPHVVKSRVAREQAALVFAFQYLIGNADWSLVTARGEENCCHNVNLLQKDGMSYLVPYDFDLSGFVNARYADQRRATRRYRGYCFEGLDPAPAIHAIVAIEETLLGVVSGLPDANEKDAGKRLAFLARFFDSARAGRLADLARDRVPARCR